MPGKSHGRSSLVGCSPWGREESDMTEQLHFHFSLSCIGEGNGNPLQCSCLENPREGAAWWAAFYGVAQSRTRLKWLRCSSSSSKTSSSLKDWISSVSCFLQINSTFLGEPENNLQRFLHSKLQGKGMPGGSVVNSPPANTGDTGSIPSLGQSHMRWSN